MGWTVVLGIVVYFQKALHICLQTLLNIAPEH